MPKFIDITGQRFGEWEVLSYYGSRYWTCRCSCGNIRNVLGKTLRSGKSLSCGHKTNQLVDITNQLFGRWKVLSYYGDGYWTCECQCGNKTISTIRGADLRSGKSTNCGCVRSEKIAIRNSTSRERLEGMQFSDWTVIGYVGDKHYKCKCSCGKIKNVSSRDLKNGISKSCGHNNGKSLIKDISGYRFGKLTPIKYMGNKYYLCRCDCGNNTIVRKNNLLNNSTRSCGCGQNPEKYSKEEIVSFINEFLNNHGRLPCIDELSKIIDRHPGNTRRYIDNYNLHEYIYKIFDSTPERELYELFDNAKLHDRKLLHNKEIDIYSDILKLAVEFNGNYWHSDNFKYPEYHQDKTLDCLKLGIRLIHIFEYEWDDPITREKIINMIKTYQGKSRVIHARNTEIKIIDNRIAKDFCNKYHLQNGINSKINIGCFLNNELIGVMTFGKPRFNKTYQYELLRLCWKFDVAVTGGTNKMFKFFIRMCNPESIVTYCNLDKFTGKTYEKLGFRETKDSITKPSYKWYQVKGNFIMNRYATQKHKLLEAGLGTEDDTEDSIMRRLGFCKIFDCGNKKYEWFKED